MSTALRANKPSVSPCRSEHKRLSKNRGGRHEASELRHKAHHFAPELFDSHRRPTLAKCASGHIDPRQDPRLAEMLKIIGKCSNELASNRVEQQ
jgi:hypothetical protein